MQSSGHQVGLQIVDGTAVGCHACYHSMMFQCSMGNDGEKKSDSELRG